MIHSAIIPDNGGWVWQATNTEIPNVEWPVIKIDTEQGRCILGSVQLDFLAIHKLSEDLKQTFPHHPQNK